MLELSSSLYHSPREPLTCSTPSLIPQEISTNSSSSKLHRGPTRQQRHQDSIPLLDVLYKFSSRFQITPHLPQSLRCNVKATAAEAVSWPGKLAGASQGGGFGHHREVQSGCGEVESNQVQLSMAEETYAQQQRKRAHVVRISNLTRSPGTQPRSGSSTEGDDGRLSS